jgi:rRNA-processing protein Efg1
MSANLLATERQKATRLLKKLRKRLLAAESTEEIETLKAQMHIVEVDLNYTQYYPLSEPYISLYPQKSSSVNETDSSKEPKSHLKPPLWSEVEKCMEIGTLTRLRNRTSVGQAQVLKPLERKLVKAKPQPSPLDMTGMNRRERRSQRGAKESRIKNKSMAFAKNKAFGASQSGMSSENAGQGHDNDSDGGFFEE